MQEAEFILKSMFIVHPNPNSDYKLRIIINHESSEEKIKNNIERYHFKFAINQTTTFEKPYGSIVLLERQKNEAGEERFLEIGKGNIDFNEVLLQTKSERASMNGVIYGTRANNFDKLIAKYSYDIVKRKILQNEASQQQIPRLNGKNIKFKDHILKQKLPILKFKQSILDQNNEINAKIRKLSQTIEEESGQSLVQSHLKKKSKGKKLVKVNDEEIKYYSNQNQGYKQISRISTQQHGNTNRYYYKISEKLEKNIKEQKYEGLKWIHIKNIKIFCNQSMPSHEQSDTIRQKPTLLKIYEHSYSKLLQIVFPLPINSNNSIIPLPIPSTASYLKFEVISQDGRQKLQGSTHILSSINKTVDLYNAEEEEKGFISVQVLKQNGNLFDPSKYEAQIKQFCQLSKHFPSTYISKEPSLSIFKNKHIKNEGNPVKKVFQFPDKDYTMQRSKVRPRYDLPISKRSITQFNHNSSQKSEKQQKTRRLRVRRPKYSLQTYESPLIGSKKSSNNETSKLHTTMTKSLSLKIKNIYIHLYDYEPNSSFQLRLATNQEKTTVDVIHGYNGLEDTGPILLNDLTLKEEVMVNCYASNHHSLLGGCAISVNSLIKSSAAQFKVFLAKQGFFIGYISCDISLYRIKNNQARAIRKSPPSLPLHNTSYEEYELSLSSDQLSNSKLINKFPNKSAKNDFNESFLLQQQHFS